MKLRILTLLTGCIAVALSLLAADTYTHVFDPSIRSLQVSNPDNFGLPPVIRMGTQDRVVVTFDMISPQREYLQYRLVHCNAGWQPSGLIDSEIIDGFNIADIDDYGFSENTFIQYVNYRIEIPSEDMRPLRSGNYLLQIFQEDNPSETLCQARFSVSENAAAIVGRADGKTDRGFNDDKQQIEFAANTKGLKISNPFTDLYAIVTQNGDTRNSRTLYHPMRVSGDNIVYEHQPELIFPAGNEFRRFETVRAATPGMHVDSTRIIDGHYHAFLMPDAVRKDNNYQFDRTQNGRFLIREYNATDSDLGSDYVTVHFRLDAEPLPGCDIYVDGELASSAPESSFKMKYDPAIRAYTLALPLKQGSYNYRYITGCNASASEPSAIEGDFFETQNRYDIELWLHNPGARADRLIGNATIISVP